MGLLFFSCLAVSAGLYFRAHYFILMLPVIALLAGLAISSTVDLVDRSKLTVMRDIPTAIFVLLLATSLMQEAWFFFRADDISASRYVYERSDFPEAAEIGRYIQQHSSPSARIVVLGSEPQIMFYSRRRSATGYLYAYSLTEEQKYAATMQRELESEVEAANPEYLIFVQDWVIGPRSDTRILAWFRTYVGRNYELVGVMRVRDGFILRSEAEIKRDPGDMVGALLLFRRTTL